MQVYYGAQLNLNNVNVYFDEELIDVKLEEGMLIIKSKDRTLPNTRSTYNVMDEAKGLFNLTATSIDGFNSNPNDVSFWGVPTL